MQADMLIENGLPELAGTAITMAGSFITQMKTKSDGVTLRLHIARARQCFAVGQFEDSADHANKALQVSLDAQGPGCGGICINSLFWALAVMIG